MKTHPRRKPPAHQLDPTRVVSNHDTQVDGGRRADPVNDRERRLLAAIAAGDEMALTVIHSRYRRRIASFARKITGRCDMAQEVANDTLCVIWQSAAGFKGASRVSTWIPGIAYRLSMKTLRTNCRWRRPDPLDERAEPHDPWSEGEVREWLAAALAQLSEEQRTVLRLSYQLDLSCKEIAVKVECPVGTVKTRMYHGRRKLRTLLPRLAGFGNT
ncbi:MAG: polymerase, sigma-24 subunit, subfamily [Gammaproteobacteria bacterium]|nr:polymerase, sigma-24 subunit, subfamily [Gammaproteobacteria bacterium]